MSGRESFRVVESYGTGFVSNEELEADITTPYYRVRGRSFQRTIYRPIGRMDLLVRQVRNNDEELYEYSSLLPAASMENGDLLRHWINQYPPPANIRVIPYQFNHLGWNWNDTATVLSHNVDNDYFFDGVTPFGVECDEAFGTITLMREENRWRSEDWRQFPPEPIIATECDVCLESINHVPINDLLGLRCCQHVFHRSCLLPWVWTDHANPSCPACMSLI